MAVGRRTVISWCLFDWATSPHPTIIVTFVFSAYFAQGVVGNEIEGTVLWSQAIAAAGILVAIFSPLLGAIADQSGRRKPWIATFSIACILATASLWFVTPNRSSIGLALIAVTISTICFEFVTVFYNATLSEVAPPNRIGRVGGWGWGAGYIGAIFCLSLCLFGLIQTDTPPFGLDPENAETVRATVVVVALWWILFGWPFFIFVPDRPGTGIGLVAAAKKGVPRLWRTLRNLRQHRQSATFLIAQMLYADGLATLFQFGGLYAAGTFGMSFAEIIQFGIAMNVTAGLGAFAFAWLDDALGAKPTIMISLVGLIGFGAMVLVADSAHWFWVFGLSLSLFIGPVQSASRSLMVRLSPPDMRSEMFGLYALSGKSTSFLGPLMFGLVTAHFESQRAGMATILVFWAVGLTLLALVRVKDNFRTGPEASDKISPRILANGPTEARARSMRVIGKEQCSRAP
jgi:UMF1 family MFS transporter